MKKTVAIGVVALAASWSLPHAALAQNREHQQMTADVRMLQEQTQQLALTLAAGWPLARSIWLSLTDASLAGSAPARQARWLSFAGFPGQPLLILHPQPPPAMKRSLFIGTLPLLGLLAGQRDEGAAVCFVTHDLPFAAALADRTVELGG